MLEQLDWRGLLLSWNGRMRRSHFWIGMVAIGAVNMVGSAIPVAGFLVSLFLIVPAAALSAKRLHDMGKPARLLFIPMAAWVAATLLGATMTAAPAIFGSTGAIGVLTFAGPALLILPVLLVVNLAFVLWIGLSAGVQGANAHGPDPRDAEAILPGSPG